VRPWSIEEIEATVATYFEMLRMEQAGVPYVKADFNTRLRQALANRSKAAVEYKFQNISAVLVNHDQVYIRGYLPAQNYQAALETSVLEWLDGHTEWTTFVRGSARFQPPPGPRVAPAFRELLSTPPDQRRMARPSWVARPRLVDFVRIDAANRQLGQQGEELVFELEQRRLHDDEHRPDLARQVRWVSRDDGDGAGYDIRSFDGDERPRLIEVKTTGQGKYFPFIVTRNEVEVSRRESPHYHLYRLYDFAASPGLYVLDGAIDDTCSLVPTAFRAMALPGGQDDQPPEGGAEG